MQNNVVHLSKKTKITCPMNTIKFSPKDTRIIKENPSKSPDELLAAGISKKAYERLKAEYRQVPMQNIVPVKVEAIQGAAIIKQKQPQKFVLLRNLRTGLTARLRKVTADMLLSTYPKNYKTV